MKKSILLCVCLMASVFVNAQIIKHEWAKGMEGVTNAYGYGSSITVDHEGSVLTVGYYNRTTDFDPGTGVYNLTGSGFFISKLDTGGNFLWAKKLEPGIGSIAVDANNNVFIAGSFSGNLDFDPDPVGVYMMSDTTVAGYIGEGYVLKLDPAGNFVWVKNIGGTGGSSIALDAAGNIYTMCFLNVYLADSTDCDPGTGIFLLGFPGNGTYTSSFVSKLDSSGNFIWAKSFVGNNRIFPQSIALNPLGDVYVSGYFEDSADFDPDPVGVYTLVANNLIASPMVPDAGFICKLDNSGNFLWAKSIDGMPDVSFADKNIAVDQFGNVYAIGNFMNTADMDPDPIGVFNLTSTTSSSGTSTYTLKLDASGNFVWAKVLTGAFWGQAGISIAVDPSGNVYTTGNVWDDATGPLDYDPGAGVFNLYVPTSSCYIRKLSTAGNFIWAGCTAGGSAVTGNCIAVDGAQNIYTTGHFASYTDFNPGTGNDTLYNTSNQDEIFVWKLSDKDAVGIQENLFSNNSSIYPNPTNGLLNIFVNSPIENSSVEIYNSIGALVFKQKIVSELNTVKLTDLSNGLYLVKVISDEKTLGMQKIIKQ